MHSLRSRSTLVLTAAVAGLSLFAGSQPANAIDIVPTFDSAGSSNPSFDPTGSGLQSIMNHVIAQYEDIFKDGHTLNLTYRWGDLNGGFVSHTVNAQSGGRETAGTIVFDTKLGLGGAERNWFIDSTPSSNSEFTMTQTLWRDLTPAQQTAFYNGSVGVPQTFEVGLGGAAAAGAPAAAANGYDLLTYAFSRVGNALGMSSSNNATVAETGDGDYDFAPVNVFGASLAAKSGTGSSVGFLVDDFAIQDENISNGVTGQRRLPSHSDLFAMAKAHNYLLIDAPRREFYNDGGGWTTAANWAGNRVPDANDDVYIRTDTQNGTVYASFVPTIAARNVFVSDGAGLSVGPGVTATFNTIDLRGFGSNVEADFNSLINVGTVNIQNTEFSVENGKVASTRMNIADGGYLYFRSGGTTTFTNGLVNSGRILTNDVTRIEAIAAGSLNLDGNPAAIGAPETGEIYFGAGSTTIIGSQTDAFNGYMKFTPGSAVSFSQPWTLGGVPSGSLQVGQDGLLDIQAGQSYEPMYRVDVNGATISVVGKISNYGYAVFNAPTVFYPEADVVVNDPNSSLILGTVTFNGGSYTGDGLFQFAHATIAADTTIDTEQLNLDGPGDGKVFINPGATFTVNSKTIDSFSSVGFDGSMTISSGTLVMNTTNAWGMNGEMFLTGNGSVIKGKPMVLEGHQHIPGGGIMKVSGNSKIDTKLIAGDEEGGTIEVAATKSLHLAAGFDSEVGAIFNKTGSGTLVIEGFQEHAINSTLAVHAGTVTMLSNIGGANTPNMDVQLTGSLNSFTDQRIDQLTVNAGGSLKMEPFVSGKTVLKVKGYTIAGTAAAPAGKINLGNNGMVVDHAGASPLATVAAQIKAGFNNGAFNGNGITTTVGNSLYRLGFAEATSVFTSFPATFLNEQVDATSTLIRYTVAGDADLSGTVNLDDFTRLAAAFGTSASWSGGDFNYDGVVTLNDFTLLAAGFGLAVPSDVARGSAVPEPAALGLIGTIGTWAMSRPRRRKI